MNQGLRACRCQWALSAPIVLLILMFGLLLPEPASSQSLRGSAASLDRQNEQARLHDFTYLDRPHQVRQFVAAGYLVPVVGNRDFDVHNVSFPYARPEVRLFIERLAEQYRSACGEKLVVTSLTRPRSSQPRNASLRSVHPTGMAVDLRRSGSPRCRSWLESTLLSLEAQGVLEAIYERNPPHYHIALFPRPYAQHVARVTGSGRVVAQAAASPSNGSLTHTVARGESLWLISRRYGVSEAELQAANDLAGSTIRVGQTLTLPDPAAGAEAPRSHRVSRGESLWTIARRYGVTEAQLQMANGLRGSRILVGQELIVPGSGAPAPDAFRHEVAPGESLWVIARHHGVSVDELRRRNGITSGRIYAGQVLEIPVIR